MKIVDTHQHLWDKDLFHYAWLEPLPELDRSFRLSDYRDAASGLEIEKTVFVECGDGNFVPRVVETGWRIGGDVQVTKGITAGERIVISGTFLVDSESRMKAATNP